MPVVGYGILRSIHGHTGQGDGFAVTIDIDGVGRAVNIRGIIPHQTGEAGAAQIDGVFQPYGDAAGGDHISIVRIIA